MGEGSWPKYTITAMLGVIAGVAGMFGNITITSQSRVAALEVRAAELSDTMRRIENKIDRLTDRKKDHDAPIP
jgi:hypothetical protein